MLLHYFQLPECTISYCMFVICSAHFSWHCGKLKRTRSPLGLMEAPLCQEDRILCGTQSCGQPWHHQHPSTVKGLPAIHFKPCATPQSDKLDKQTRQTSNTTLQLGRCFQNSHYISLFVVYKTGGSFRISKSTPDRVLLLHRFRHLHFHPSANRANRWVDETGLFFVNFSRGSDSEGVVPGSFDGPKILDFGWVFSTELWFFVREFRKSVKSMVHQKRGKTWNPHPFFLSFPTNNSVLFRRCPSPAVSLAAITVSSHCTDLGIENFLTQGFVQFQDDNALSEASYLHQHAPTDLQVVMKKQFS